MSVVLTAVWCLVFVQTERTRSTVGEEGVPMALGLVTGSKNPNGRPSGHTTKKKTANGHWPYGGMAGWPYGRNTGRMAGQIAENCTFLSYFELLRALSSKLTNPWRLGDRMAVCYLPFGVWPDGRGVKRPARRPPGRNFTSGHQP